MRQSAVRWIAVALVGRPRVVILDDTATSGGSLIQAVDVVRAETEAQVVGAVALVDRLEGAREALCEAGVPFEAVFTRDEL